MDIIEKNSDEVSSAGLGRAAADIEMGARSSLRVKGLGDNTVESSDAETRDSGPTISARIASPPIVRFVEFGHRMHQRAVEKFKDAYPHILDRLKRLLKLCGLTFAIIFIVMLASFIMALSHWFTVVFGHFILRYIVPESIDDAFVKMRLDFTMVFSALGAFVVNLPPFITFVLSIPFTFDQAVLEGSAAPANEFIKRITPRNRYLLLLLKYAPRLSAGPIGCMLYWFLSAPDHPEETTLNPLHAFMAGAAGEVVLTAMGLIKNALKKRKDAGETTGGPLPM